MKKQILFWFLILSTFVAFADESAQEINNQHVDIQDALDDYTPGIGVSSVSFSGLPYNATITNVEYEIKINHGRHRDLSARISTNSDVVSSPSDTIFKSFSQSGSGPLKRTGSTSAFNGYNPNQTFYFGVWDDRPQQIGYIYYVRVKVYYSVPTPNPTVTLNYPNNGSFTVGETINIRWSSTNQYRYGLYLLKGGQEIGTIYETYSFSSAENHNWEIDPTLNGHSLNGNNYRIKVRVWNSNGEQEQDYSNGFISISPEQTTPPAPSYVTAGIAGSSASQVVIDWTYMAPYSTYKIYRKQGLGTSNPWIHIGTKYSVTGPTTARYADNDNIQPSTEYCYRVQTCDGNNCSEYSMIDCYTTPNLPPPTTYSISGRVTNGGQGLADVNISMSLTGYQTTTDANGYYTLSNINQNTTGYLEANKADYTFTPENYHIVNLNQNLSNHDFSASSSNLTAPVLQAYPNSQTSIKLTWNAVPGANYYKAFYSDGDPCTAAEYIQGTAVHVYGLNPGQQYCFYILAYENNDGTGLISPPSNTACATPGLPMPTVQLIAPNGGETFAQGQNMNISWSSTGQHHYGLYLMKGEEQIADIHHTDNSTETSHTWNIPTTLDNGNDYRVKVVVWNTGDPLLEEHAADSSNNYFTIQSGNAAPAVQLLYPHQGEFFVNENINIQWTSNHQHHHAVYLCKGGTELENQIATLKITNGNNDNGEQSFVWKVLPTVLDHNNQEHIINGNDYKIKIVVWNEDGEAVADFSNSYISLLPNSGCQYTDLPAEHYAHDAAVYLCEQGLLQDNGYCEPDSLMNRAELAKLSYLSIDLQQNPIADDFPSPFMDLQDKTTWFYTYAKNLSYLEYQDGVAPFDKEFFNFYPEKKISRKYALKVLLETWNIDESNHSGSIPFTDPNLQNDEAYKYISKAFDLGIIEDTPNHLFKPNDNVVRGDVFVWLYRMMDVLNLNTPIPNEDDFFIPGNYTPANFANFDAMHSGNFGFYTKSSFNISEIGIPLDFAHTYNSYATEITSDLYPIKPLGFGWSHSYNSYIVEVVKTYSGDPSDQNAIVHLPSGELNVYEHLGNNQYEAVTQGIYDKLVKNGGKYELRTKHQITYTYEKFTGTPPQFPYVLTSVKDRNNNVLNIQYQLAETGGYYRIHKVVGTSGRALDFTYYAGSDLIKTVTDPLGRSVTFDYDGYNFSYVDQPNLVSYTNAEGGKTIYNYGSTTQDRHLLLSIKLPKGNTITNTYENKKLKSSKTNGHQPTQYAYNRHYEQNTPNNYITTTITDPNNKTAIIQYNKAGNPNHITKNNNTVNINYNTAQPDLPETITVNGKQTDFVYDNQGNMTQANLPMGVSYSYAYNTRNDVTSYTDPKGNVYHYNYNAYGNLVKITTPNNSVSTFTVNSKGQVTKATNPMGIAVNYNYDTYGNIIKTQAPEGITVQSSYDIVSRLLSVTNPNGHTVNYQYDKNDNMLKESFGGQHTQYNFDQNENLTAIINAKGFATNMEYDDNDLLTQVEFQGAKDKYSYYEDGKTKTYTNPKGTVFTYGYDNKDRLQTISAPGAGTITYTYYESNNNLKSVSNSNGTIYYTYDELNRLISTNDYFGNTIAYEYDLNSNRTAITYPGNKQVSYTYNNDNRLTKVTDWMGNTTQYTYRADGALTKVSYPNGTYNEYQYDNAGRMTAMGWKKADGSTINHYAFTLDPMGNHLSESKTELYDILPLSNTTENYSYNNSNQMLSAADHSFSYDANGNTIAGNGNTYVYDAYDQLTAVSGNLQAQYSYDANGNRRKRVLNGIETRYVLDEMGLSKVLIETDAANQAQYYYVYGAGLLYRIKASDNSVQYYHYDFRGSTTAITNAAGSITHQYQYNDFGQILQSEEADPNPYRYVGQYGICYESDQLYFMRARYYNPQIGRFLSQDPIWSTNLYPYAGNNPVSSVDPSGEHPAALIIAFYAVVLIDGVMCPDENRPWDEIIEFFDDLAMSQIGMPPVAVGPAVGSLAFRGARFANRGGKFLRSLFTFKGNTEGLEVFNSLIEKFGEGYKSVAVIRGKYLPANLGEKLNSISTGSWSKIYEAGILNGSKVEVHYFYNSATGQYVNPFIKYGEWGSKAFKGLK